VVDSIDSAKRQLGNSGRLVIRPSGTEPVIRVMAEGEDEAMIEQLVDEIISTVRHVAVA